MTGTVVFDQTRERHAFYFDDGTQERYCFGPAVRPGQPVFRQGQKVRMTGRWLPGSESVFLASSIEGEPVP